MDQNSGFHGNKKDNGENDVSTFSPPTELDARLKYSHRLIMLKWFLQASSLFDRIFVKRAGNQDRHNISDEFEFGPDRSSHFGVTRPLGRIKFSIFQ